MVPAPAKGRAAKEECVNGSVGSPFGSGVSESEKSEPHPSIHPYSTHGRPETLNYIP